MRRQSREDLHEVAPDVLLGVLGIVVGSLVALLVLIFLGGDFVGFDFVFALVLSEHLRASGRRELS